MKKMKKTLAGISALTLTMSMTACGGDNGGSTADTTADTTVTTTTAATVELNILKSPQMGAISIV